MTQQQFNVGFIPKDRLKGNTAMPNEVDVTLGFFSKYPTDMVKKVFGRESSSLTAHQLFRRDPQAYKEMKYAAIYRDRILGEDSLPLKERLTPEQLETKWKADRAAAEDNLIPLSPQLSDRLGLPLGSKLSFADLQKRLGKQPTE